jgi:hypothetical protein
MVLCLAWQNTLIDNDLCNSLKIKITFKKKSQQGAVAQTCNPS